MLITGRIWKAGAMWLAESEIADVCTQGPSESDARAMLADAFESLVGHKGFKVTVQKGDNDSVTIESNDPAVFAAFLLQRIRSLSGRSLSQAASALGKLSKNAYARYEQGAAVPTITKFDELLGAVSSEYTLAIVPRKRVTAIQFEQIPKPQAARKQAVPSKKKQRKLPAPAASRGGAR